jgi:hypothetical protein
MKTTKMKSICISGTAIALTLTILTIAGVPAFATKDHHCTTGYQDCYNLGYQAGQSDAQNNVSIDWSVYDSHSSAWQHGYDDGVNSVRNTNIYDVNSPSNSQSATVTIRGDNNRVNIEQGQSISNGSDDGGSDGHHDGGFLPECRVLCLGIK